MISDQVEPLTTYRKNRRDGATVSTRVLSLAADKVGRELFTTAAAVNADTTDQTGPRRRRRKDILASARL